MNKIIVIISLFTSMSLVASVIGEKQTSVELKKGKVVTCVVEPDGPEASFEQFTHTSPSQSLSSKTAYAQCKKKYSSCRVVSCN